MEKYILDLGATFNQVDVTIRHKPIKNIHLKVFRDMSVILSVPDTVEDEWIVNLLNQKRDWIIKQLYKYKQSSGYNSLIDVKSGTSTQLLGKDRRIIKKSAVKNKVEEDEKNIILYLKNMNNEQEHRRVLEKWWRKKAYEIYSYELDVMFEKIFKKHNLEKPTLYVKKMKTMWGSCTPSKNKITINEYLLKADIRCIQYVILHEMTHLIYPYHNEEFYAFLTVYMPDWKSVKKQLDMEVVQGL